MASKPNAEVRICGVSVLVVPVVSDLPGGFVQQPFYQVCLLTPGHDGQCVTGAAD